MSALAGRQPVQPNRHSRSAHHGAARAGSTSRYATGFGAVRPTVLALAKLVLLPLASAAPRGLWERKTRDASDVVTPKSMADPSLWAYFGIAVALVLLGGVFAGLTIALMGQDETYLQVIATSGEGKERKSAKKVLKLLKNGKHWVLVTLLLGNVITNETLPIVLDRSLGGGWPAVVSSTVLIVIFGEIAPQSVCVRYGLSIGAIMSPFVLILMWIMCPVAWPTAKLLDWLLGEDHGTMYKKAGLKTLVQLHKSLGAATGERLMEDEVTIINSVLDLKEKPVGDIMTPMQDVFTMSADTVLDERMMDTILSQGYSRIPIYAPENYRNFIGMLLVKILITYDPEDGKRVRDFALATLPETAPYTSCLDIINFFQEGKSHMVLVSDFPGQDKGALGVVTLEDVIEELIGEEIIDESDVFVDVHKAIRRMNPAPKTRFNRASISESIDESEMDSKDAGEDAPLLRRTSTDGSRRRGMANGQGQTTLLMRRRSSAASEGTHDTLKPIPVRTSTEDMRRHLKHLGPSNVASKPRATKFASVKIKPGVGTIPENKAANIQSELPPRPKTAEDRPLTPEVENAVEVLKSDKGASDGVAALRAGYGTLGADNRRLSTDKIPASEASKVAQDNASTHSAELNAKSSENTDGQADSVKYPERLVVGNTPKDGDTVGEMSGPPSGIMRTRRVARSGSITETTVDSGGMQKVVLETTSSSSDVEENGSAKLIQTEDSVEEGENSADNATDGKQSKKPRKKRGKGKKRGNG